MRISHCSQSNLHTNLKRGPGRGGRGSAAAEASGGGGAQLSGAVLSVQLDYLPVCGNASTVLCLLLCLLLNLRYLGGSLYCVFALAPLMLLLSPGKTLFRNLTEAVRVLSRLRLPFCALTLAYSSRTVLLE